MFAAHIYCSVDCCIKKKMREQSKWSTSKYDLPNVSNSVLRQRVTQMISVSPFVLGDREKQKKKKTSPGADTVWIAHQARWRTGIMKTASNNMKPFYKIMHQREESKSFSPHTNKSAQREEGL